MSVVAAAVVASAAIGAVSANKASKRAQQSADKMTAVGDEAAQLGRDQFDWYKAEYERTRPQREATAAQDQKIADAQYGGMQYAMQQARDFDARNKSVFQPLEDRIVSDALTFDEGARGQQLANEAGADVTQAFGSAQDQGRRSLTRMGINPASGAYQQAVVGQDANFALAKAGAMNRARTQARSEGTAKRMDAVGLGKGIVGNQATMQQIAQGGGNAAVGAGSAGVAVNQSGAPMMTQGFNSAMQGFGTMANLNRQGGIYQSIANGYSDQRNNAYGDMVGGLFSMGKSGMDAWGSLGNALTGSSDKRKKKGTGKPADTEGALDELMAVQVEEGWEYDPAKGAPPGLAGKKHIGPMAQDVRQHMGEKAAPGGEVLDFVEINGKLMASMQEIAKRVERLEGKK